MSKSLTDFQINLPRENTVENTTEIFDEFLQCFLMKNLLYGHTFFKVGEG